MTMIRLLLLLLFYAITINGKHFDGGTITWRPINPNINSSVVPITITQSYFWTASVITCATNVPISTGSSSFKNANLTCITDCSTDGGYSANQMIDILTDCQAVSSASNVMSSRRSTNINLTADAHFSLSYTDTAWVALNYPAISNLPWSMICSIDLRLRPDGIINTAPVASVISPRYAIVNQTTQIIIPISDANAGDDVRCRWAVNATVNECGGICYPSSVPSNTTTTLSNCTISFFGPRSGVWYGVALQVEDFISSSSLTPMSSVPVQFLIYVMPQPACGLAPVMLPFDSCLDVQVGVQISFNMSAMTLCNPNVSNVNSIFVATGISGMSVNNLTESSTNASVSYVTFTWTPSASQLGSQQLCVLAYTDEKLQSQQYCVTFNVISSSPTCFTTTTTTTSTTSFTSSTTSSTSSTTSSSTSSTTSSTSSTTSSTTSTSTSSTTTTSTLSTTTVEAMITVIDTVIESNASKQQLMWLALFLPAFLSSLCCSLFCLYLWYWDRNTKLRRRQWILLRKKHSQQISLI